MTKSGRKASWAFRVAGVCTLVALGGIGAGVAFAGSPSSPTKGKVAVANVSSTKWIEDGASSKAPTAPTSSQPTTRPRLTQSATGPLVDKLQALVQGFLPAGASVISTAEFDSVGAATVVSQSAGMQYSFTLQKVKRALNLDAITGGSSADTLATTSTGTQTVTVEHLLPSASQVVLVRPDGVMLTVTVTPVTDAEAPTSQTQAGSTSALAPAALRNQLLAKFDNTSLDAAASTN